MKVYISFNVDLFLFYRKEYKTINDLKYLYVTKVLHISYKIKPLATILYIGKNYIHFLNSVLHSWYPMI